MTVPPIIPLVLWCAALTLIAEGLLRALSLSARSWRLEKTNFQGKPIPDLGAALWIVSLIGYGVLAIVQTASAAVWTAFAWTAFASGLLGLIDDCFGSHRFGGFRGHFGQLLKGRLTTGAAKAIFLPIAFYCIAVLALGLQLLPAFVLAAVVSMFANTINALDMRPARAVTAWMIGSLGLFVLALLTGGSAAPVLLLAGPVAIYLPRDARGAGMLGDTGANLLGALLGLQLVFLIPLWAQVALGILLFGVQVLCEIYRQQPGILDQPWLRWLDLLARRIPRGS